MKNQSCSPIVHPLNNQLSVLQLRVYLLILLSTLSSQSYIWSDYFYTLLFSSKLQLGDLWSNSCLLTLKRKCLWTKNKQFSFSIYSTYHMTKNQQITLILIFFFQKRCNRKNTKDVLICQDFTLHLYTINHLLQISIFLK